MPTQPARVDPRGLRFVAGVSAVVLAASLATADVAPGVSTALLVVQALVFAAGALAGPSRGPWALVFAAVVRPHLGAPAETEDARPPRFAQAVGLAFTVVALVGAALGLTPVLLAATAAALVAAVLNAALGLCLGCEAYLLLRRAFPQEAART